jgi:hypothetical protein
MLLLLLSMLMLLTSPTTMTMTSVELARHLPVAAGPAFRRDCAAACRATASRK